MSFLFTGCKSLVESLERRLALGAPLALTDEGLIVSAPGEDEDEAWLDPGINEPLGDNGSDPFAVDSDPPLLPVESASETPADTVDHDVAGVDADTTPTASDTDETSDATASSFPQYTSSAASITAYAGTMENSPTPGYFRVSVSSIVYGGATPPSSASVTFDLPTGTNYAVPGTDYDGPLTTRSVVVPLDATGAGVKDVQFSAIDDPLVEPDKIVAMQVTGGTNSKGGPVHPGTPPSGFTVLASGDYDAKVTMRGYDEPAVNDTWPCPLNGDEEYTIKLTTDPNDKAVAGKEVQLSKIRAVEGADAVIVDAEGEENPTGPVKVTTDADGKATFTIRGKAAGRVEFTFRYRNDEDQLVEKRFTVLV